MSAAVRVMVLRAAGTNCDAEALHAWTIAGGVPELVHIHRLIERPTLLREYRILTIPGGFSYGDDIAAGRILANQFVQNTADETRRFIEAGKLILGVCNGFQVLVKAGLLPFPEGREHTVTLAFNESGRFEARWVRLRAGRTRCRFLTEGAEFEFPVAHAEGRLVCRDETLVRQLMVGGHVALSYTNGGSRCPYPANPNGSAGDIAGLTDATGQILGLMPHPERHVAHTQHPLWTRRTPTGEPDGLRFFKAALASLV